MQTSNIRKGLVLFALTSLALLTLLRLAIYLLWQFPAPVGDSILFLSVSHYHCIDGLFRSPIFPIDAEHARYTWHGILQPAVMSFLSFDCGPEGAYLAFTSLLVSSCLLVMYVGRDTKAKWLLVLFAFIIFALQVKQGFRPEVLAISLIVSAEYLLNRKSWIFSIPFSALAWTHPLGFLIYALYVVLQHGNGVLAEFQHQLKRVVFGCLLVNACFLLLYPFPIADHFAGLLQQATKVAGTRDPGGDLQTYFIRSDFFPLFGIAFFSCYFFLSLRNKALLLLCPIWYFGLRAPTHAYNMVPIFAAFLYQIFLIGSQKSRDIASAAWFGRIQIGVIRALKIDLATVLFLFVATLAALGVTQGVARDLISIYKYEATHQSSKQIYEELVKNGNNICEVPGFFTLWLDYDKFEKAYRVKLKHCSAYGANNDINLFAASGRPFLAQNCKPSHVAKHIGVLGRLFRSDSGYSFHICKPER